MVIPCLCLFIALSSLFSELVGAKPLHLLTQIILLLKHPTGVFVAGANAVLLGRACPKPYFIISIMTDQRLIYSNCQSLQVH